MEKLRLPNERLGKVNKQWKTILFPLLFIASVAVLMGQPNPSRRSVKLVYHEYADSTDYDKDNNPDIHVMRGNVKFRHDSTRLYCDSAYAYMNENSLDAFSNVRIEQGDSLFIYGDFMTYDGNVSLAQMRNNVRMDNNNMSLFTDNFDFNRIEDIGYFFEGGMLVDSINELTSTYGQYSPTTKIAHFYHDVTLVNPQFTLTTDTLIYNTDTHVASIVSPSVIESDSGIIYSSSGWYNTNTDEATLFLRSKLVSKDKVKDMTADTLFYNRNTGVGEAFGNMVLNDTVKRITLMGDYGYYDERQDYAFACDSAQMLEYSQGDTLFLHADTLRMLTLGEEREVRAYYGVRFYRFDIQGVCDSMQFNTRDTVLYMYQNPVLWNTGYQITGDTIHILFNDSTLKQVNVLNYAFAIQEVDSSYFNQLKGRNLYAFFEAGELHRIDVNGNAESVYYPLEDDGITFIGQNNTQSSFIKINVKNRKPVRILWEPDPTGEMLPIPDLTPDKKYLKDFIDYNYIRPKDSEDIFSKTVRKAEDIPAPRRQRRHK